MTRSLDTDAATSTRMAAVLRRDTSIESRVRAAVHASGHRYRICSKELPGSPDLSNRSKKWAIFVNGCFWHHHPGCPRATTPKRNKTFWQEKFRKNSERDLKKTQDLERMGFFVLTIWECETSNPTILSKLISSKFRTSRPLRGTGSQS